MFCVMRIKMLQPPPVVLVYAGIRYEVRPHWKCGYIAVFCGDQGRFHFKVSETFDTQAELRAAFGRGFEVPDYGPMKTVVEELISMGFANIVHPVGAVAPLNPLWRGFRSHSSSRRACEPRRRG